MKREKAAENLVNRTGLARRFHVTLKTVDDWVARGCPFVKRPEGDGDRWEFDVSAVESWRKNDGGSSARIVDKRLADARIRRAEAEAELAEHELARKRGALVFRSTAIEILTKQLSAVRAKLVAIPAKLAPVVAGASTPSDARDLLDAAIDEALSELSDPKTWFCG